MVGDNGNTGLIFNIQHYAIHDGPGIRTAVFLKGCPLRCSWCQNPESQRMRPEILLFRNECARCGRCVAVCATGAARLSGETSTVDRAKCIACGNCVQACLNEARKLAGRYATLEEIMVELLSDRVFYKNSGGGVTLTGGEPSAQESFATAILRSCKEQGLHTVLETCGYVAWPRMKRLLGYVDLVFFDIKCIDAEKHAIATGVSNSVILANAKRVAACKPMKVRVPLVPGFNDSEYEIEAIVRFVRAELGLSASDIELLRYNRLGESKYERLDRAGVHLQEQSEEYVEHLRAIIDTSR